MVFFLYGLLLAPLLGVLGYRYWCNDQDYSMPVDTIVVPCPDKTMNLNHTSDELIVEEADAPMYSSYILISHTPLNI